MSKSPNLPRQALAVMTIAGALVSAAPARAQQTSPALPTPPHGEETPPAPAKMPKSGVVEPPNVDPKMARPVPNVDPAMDKPPAGMAQPGGSTPAKTPPDVQPR
jgi:hypothetical protein